MTVKLTLDNEIAFDNLNSGKEVRKMANKDDRGDELEKLHNRGQENRAAGYGNYKPPTSPASAGSVLLDSKKEHAEKVENTHAYDAGWKHGDKQRK